MEEISKINKARKRNRILAAALGFVATTGACGAFGNFATFENRALFGDETSSAASTANRRLVAEPTDGKLAKPKACKAFLVAADDYGDAANPLPCTKNDVKALKTRFEALGFETVVLETGAGPSNAPTKGIIEREFGKFVERLRPGDFALVYLSGHGLKPIDSDESFFAPVDVDVENLFETSVSINGMLDALKASDATFRWMIVDACRDDPLNPSDEEPTPFKGASRSIGSKALGDVKKVPDAVALLQSCQAGERSYEGGGPGAEDIENGFFTLSLLEALDENDSKADADQDGVLSFWEMTDYVSKRTDELARVCYRESQNPNLSGSIVNFALLDGLLIDGIKKSEWNKANALYQEACVLRRQKKWREALAKIRGARKINEKRDEYKTAEAEIQAQVDATVASEKRAEADKLAADAWKAFDLGGEANVGEAIRLMKKSLELVDLTANRRALKTFEDELEALRNPAPPADSRTVLYRLGREAAFGLNGTKLNARRGFDLLTQAAESGSTDAKGALAVLYFDGCAATPPNFDEAFKLAKEASDAGNPWGQYVLGRCCREGLGAEKDATLAETQFKAARAGFEKLAATDALASTYFALCLYKAYGGGVNLKEAARRFREAADAGLPLAAYWLAACYQHGNGVEQDLKQAFEWYRKGAEAGHGAAMCEFGLCYRNGRGVEKNESLAFEWYQKGAEAGNGAAMRNLGLCYRNGRGVEKNESLAFEWYQKGAEAGDGGAMCNLGLCYRNGRGVEKNESLAFEWYQKGAEAGSGAAMCNLGVCYEHGNGVTKNLDEAERWYRKAIETDPAQKDFAERGLERVKAARATQE